MEDDLISLGSQTASSISDMSEENPYPSTLDLINHLQEFSLNETEGQIQPIISRENKMLLIIKRTYYMNEMDKIERYLNSVENIKELNLIKNEEKKLIFCFNKLSNNEKMYINLEDYYKSLNIQKRIVNILKKYIVYSIN